MVVIISVAVGIYQRMLSSLFAARVSKFSGALFNARDKIVLIVFKRINISFL